MRILPSALCLATLLMLLLLTPRASAQALPACNPQYTRHGHQLTMGLQQLSQLFNQKLSAAHSHFSDLQLSSEGGNKLKVEGKKNGTELAISGPLQPVNNGSLKLHAEHIIRNGTPEKGMMDLFGKDLADYAHFSKTQILSAHGDNLFIHPDPLLNVSGKVSAISLTQSSITLTFASQPCQ